MTRNQLEYHANLEKERANRENERLNREELSETKRANKVREKQQWVNTGVNALNALTNIF